eukprot:jgi/Hompol1/1007/HPOL_001402-RA
MAAAVDKDLNCKLMDGFAIVIQISLATIAFGSLLVKRLRERPRRPMLIWAMDTSKQALAATVVHFANVFFSIEGTKDSAKSANPCVWYFLNLLLDTTIGVGILYAFLQIIDSFVRYCRITETDSGYYGNPPRFMPWLKQFIVFMAAWFFVKLTVVLALDVFPIFGIFGEWILAPLAETGNPRLQVLFVMLLFPLVMNIIQAWLIDTVIKGKVGGGKYQTVRSGTGSDAAMSAEDVVGDQHAGMEHDRIETSGSREDLESVAVLGEMDSEAGGSGLLTSHGGSGSGGSGTIRGRNFKQTHQLQDMRQLTQTSSTSMQRALIR